ncbi:PREDICTED: uncharacterized protein LOC107349391 [Acropora digitifera]|uniref:uncharacterized protein LOC107349391 n=1 Tax=Acropora digitifera TaxID=70779 RepID=UPI00077AC468|nr:PREDICTED: uncharacterized protein LOC107349391 [Acropora digitifera]
MRHPTPKPFMLKIVYDIKLWIADHAEELHEHTVAKCFKFELNEEGKAVMHYRNWSHEQWQGPIVMLKSIPSGKPNLVSPSLALRLRGFEERHSQQVSPEYAPISI